MNDSRNHKTNLCRGAVAALTALGAAALVVACSGSSSTSSTGSALAAAEASSTDSSGTLTCSPSSAQVSACSGLTAGADCTLAATDGGTARSGTCRTSLDGTQVACAPTPPAPPAELTAACDGKAAGDTCTAQEAFGGTTSGTCVTPPGSTTLICGRVLQPPAEAVSACTGLSSGASCVLPHPHEDGGTASGVCSYGPAGTGTLACAPPQDLVPPATEACTGKAAGATCTLGRDHHQQSGTCETPAAGGDAVCVVTCADLAGPFMCGGGHGGPGGPGGPGGGSNRGGPGGGDGGTASHP